MKTRRCARCRRRRRLSQFTGRDRYCRRCRAAYQRAWIAGDRDGYNARKSAYYHADLERWRQYHREYQRRRRAAMKEGTWKP